MGITNLDTQNICLLSKWLIQLINEDGIWQQVLKKKYFNNKPLSQIVKKPGDSQFWSGLMEVKDFLLARGKFVVKNGKQVRFWEDWWVGHEPLMKQFPGLYNIVRKRNQTIASVFSRIPLNIAFRRALMGDRLRQWNVLVSLVAHVNLGEIKDQFVWKVNQSSIFSVKSMYSSLMEENTIPVNCVAWKLKVPLKIKIFLWYLDKGVILTKDNLIKRKWKGDAKCCFCNCDETIRHLFFECHLAKCVWQAIQYTFAVTPPVNITCMMGSWLNGYPAKLKKQMLIGVSAICWALWLCRNEAVFQKRYPNSFLQVIFRGTYWARLWSQLSEEETMKALMNLCQRLEGVVLEFFNRGGWNCRSRFDM